MVTAEPAAPSRWRLGVARALACLPALLAGMLCLRVADLVANGGNRQVFPAALLNDVLALLRYGWLVLGLAYLALLPGVRFGRWIVGTLWSLVLLFQMLLVEYHATTGLPLGADLFAYTWQEIATTTHGGALSTTPALGLACALVAAWAVLFRRGPGLVISPGRGTVVLLAVLVLAPMLTRGQVERGAAPPASITFNKIAYLVDDSVRWLRDGDGLPGGDAVLAAQRARLGALDPSHPFVRDERTPDTLGPVLALDPKAPPNIVVIVVEGLGRNFSGPGARLGSFTPFLDSLGSRSLYFENFIAPQGRTFGVLPSLLGSLPFASSGFSGMDKHLPAHHALPALLGRHGYASRFYIGSNLEFDNEGEYLRSAGVQTLVSQRDFSPKLKKSSEWGYADNELFDLVLQRDRDATGPALTIVQTSSMHTPFAFPGKDRYLRQVETHLDLLGVPLDRREPYRRQRDIYASILYADDALRAYFDKAGRLPRHTNTIYLITGDHRLPEIPMETRLERYHVPLIVYSPLLKAPAAIKSVSSHFDVTPALLAMLSNRYALDGPAQVTWLGSGLDLEPAFRNIHAFPIKQTKTEPSEFVSGTAYLSQDRLYGITDGMQTEPLASPGAHALATAQLHAYIAANEVLIQSSQLVSPRALDAAQPYRAAGRALAQGPVAAQSGELFVADAQVRRAANGDLLVAARFANRAIDATPDFVPLLVVTDDKGSEVAEAYGKAVTLGPSANMVVELTVPVAKLAPGILFASVIPSNPDHGKPVGTGRYHVSIAPR